MSNNLFSLNTSKLVPSTAISEPNKWWYQNTNGQVLRIPCEASTEYTLSMSTTINNTIFRISTIANDNIPSGTYGNYETVTDITKSGAIHSYSFTTNSSAKYILFQTNSNCTTDAINSLMLNYGSTALPYEVGDYDWHMDENNNLIINAISAPIDWQPPYPAGMWVLDDNDILTNSMLPEVLIDYQGAFNKCAHLVEVTIPKTVKSIGKWSFRETLLTSVTIASDCTYYDTSFPENCVINFYPD